MDDEITKQNVELNLTVNLCKHDYQVKQKTDLKLYKSQGHTHISHTLKPHACTAMCSCQITHPHMNTQIHPVCLLVLLNILYL